MGSIGEALGRADAAEHLAGCVYSDRRNGGRHLRAARRAPLRLAPSGAPRPIPIAALNVPHNWKIVTSRADPLTENVIRLAMTRPKSTPVINGKSAPVALMMGCNPVPRLSPGPVLVAAFDELTGAGHFKTSPADIALTTALYTILRRQLSSAKIIPTPSGCRSRLGSIPASKSPSPSGCASRSIFKLPAQLFLTLTSRAHRRRWRHWTALRQRRARTRSCRAWSASLRC